MREWPQQHKTLGALLILVFIASAAAYAFLLRPKAGDVDGLRRERNELQADLDKTGWPADKERLQVLLEEARKQLNGTRRKDGSIGTTGAKARSMDILESATAMFDGKIEELFETKSQFMDGAFRIDYEEEYSALERKLAAADIAVTETVFGISADTSDEFTYRLLLQVWTVDALVDLVRKNQLTIAKHTSITVPTGTPREPKASLISVQPVKTIVLHEDDEEPYLLQCPVKMSLRGNIDQVTEFLRDLHRDGRFFPINRFELLIESPARYGKPDEDGIIAVEVVRVNLECASLFRPYDSAPKQKVEVDNSLPAGF